MIQVPEHEIEEIKSLLIIYTKLLFSLNHPFKSFLHLKSSPDLIELGNIIFELANNIYYERENFETEDPHDAEAFGEFEQISLMRLISTPNISNNIAFYSHFGLHQDTDTEYVSLSQCLTGIEVYFESIEEKLLKYSNI